MDAGDGGNVPRKGSANPRGRHSGQTGIAQIGSGGATRAQVKSGDGWGGTDTGRSFERLVVIGFGIERIGDGGAFPLESGIPVVFDGVVGATVEQASDCGPLVAEPGVRSHDSIVLLGRERPVLDVGRELIAPPQTAGLAGSTGNGLAD